MKLITEEIENVEVIVEERGGKKSMFIEGIFFTKETLRTETVVFIPVETLDKEVSRYNEAFVWQRSCSW